jgi:hypothetical protein
MYGVESTPALVIDLIDISGSMAESIDEAPLRGSPSYIRIARGRQ